MDHRRQSQHHRPSSRGTAFTGHHRKKNATPLLNAWEALWRLCEEEVSSTDSCTRRLREHLLAHLICPGRHTVYSLITVFGKQFQDWTADYSLYAKDRVKEEVIFRPFKHSSGYVLAEQTYFHHKRPNEFRNEG